jgi:hypothetical protein
MILRALIGLIKADNTLFVALGNNVFARQAPQNVTRPFAVLNRISREGIDTLDGPSGMVRRRVQVDVYDQGEHAVTLIASRLRAVLEAVVHVDAAIDAASPPATMRIQAIRLLNDIDLPEEPGHARLFRRSMDFSVVHSE